MFSKYVLAVIATALAVMVWGFSSAFGSGTPAIAAPVTGPTDVVQTVTNPDGSVGTIETKTVTPVRISARMVPAAMRQSSRATTTCGYWFATGSQTYSSALWGIAGHTTQSFGWYFNCNKAWIASRFSWDKGGYHHCGGGWAIGVSVDVQECSKSNDPAIYPGAVKVYESFKVSALFNGFPVSFTKSMQACLGARGGAWNCS